MARSTLRRLALWHSPSWNCWTIAMNAGQPNLAMIFHSPSRQTVSNAFVRSTKVVYSPKFCSWHFFCSWRAAKIMSAVPRPARNPHWLSGSRSRSRWTLRRFSRIRARIFPAMESREIPRWLSQEFLFPLRLYRWMIEASLSSCGSFSCVQSVWSRQQRKSQQGSSQHRVFYHWTIA